MRSGDVDVRSAASHGFCLVGTLRRNGYPRISPCEVELAAGELCLGMMWRPPKAVDLLRDPRCVLHTPVTKKSGDEGDFKLYGRAVVANDAPVHAIWLDQIRARANWTPPEPYHLFTIDVDRAGFVVFGKDGFGMAWDPDAGMRTWNQRLE